MTRPTNCPKCQDIFMADPLLQAEAQHEAKVAGLACGMTLVDDRLEKAHAEHEPVDG